ncbi:MAG TPA: glyceraldehyde 3-phosphate dehydrogenase NAD-binding domain-containing protein, partial [Solirubrobacteraceae bacterium]
MTATRVAINGFGRMGRLALRAAWSRDDLRFVCVNETAGDAHGAAHLLCFDSVHGRWDRAASGDANTLTVDGLEIAYSTAGAPGDVRWEDHEAEVVLECSGRFRTIESLEPYFARGIKKVIVAAPVKDPRALNVVVGVNDERYDPAVHHILTAASCSTNCLAPVVKVLHEGIGIRRGSVTTLHDITNTQTIVDAAHK